MLRDHNMVELARQALDGDAGGQTHAANVLLINRLSTITMAAPSLKVHSLGVWLITA
jgi:hypothetical protein